MRQWHHAPSAGFEFRHFGFRFLSHARQAWEKRMRQWRHAASARAGTAAGGGPRRPIIRVRLNTAPTESEDGVFAGERARHRPSVTTILE